MSKETSISGLFYLVITILTIQRLQNGGYYFALNDHYDLTVLGDYYTNGSYGMRFESSYAKKYSFSGNIILDMKI
jgi:hypothetical protein